MSETWRLLTYDGVEAAAGLALDEAMLAGYARDADPDWAPTLRLYTYRSHCALVGRYQHLDAEVDLDACRRTGTGFSRRPTGGGAIVMGAGQLGVAVATRAPADRNPRDAAGPLRRGDRGRPGRAGHRGHLRRQERPLGASGARSPASACTWSPAAGSCSTPASWPTSTSRSCSRCSTSRPPSWATRRWRRCRTASPPSAGRPAARSAAPTSATSSPPGFAKALGVELRPGTTTPAEEARAAVLETERYGQRGVVLRVQPPARRHGHLGVQDPRRAGAVLPGPARPDDQERPVHRRLQRRPRAAGPLRGVAALGPPRGGDAGEAGRDVAAPTAPASACRRRNSSRPCWPPGNGRVAPAAAPVRPSGSCYFPEDRS